MKEKRKSIEECIDYVFNLPPKEQPMFKIEIISTDSSRVMNEKEIYYTSSKEEAQKYVDERKDMETNNDFVFIEETHEACIVQVTIPEFYINNELAEGNDYLEIERIIEQEYLSEAINDYINKECEDDF